MKEEIIQRASCSYENCSDKFFHKGKRKVNLQYSQMYSGRYELMRPKLMAAARNKWGNDVNIKPLVNMKPNEECVVVGTLFRKMELQPSILKEICDEEGTLPLPVSEKYSSAEDDVLILEEQQQRIELIGNISLHTAVTGMSIAVYGRALEGKFEVKDSTYVMLPDHSDIPVDDAITKGEDRYILFVSGLGIGGERENHMQLQVLIDMITGRLGDLEEQKLFSKVVRVVIAGNALSKDTQDKDSEKVAKYISRNVQAKSVVPIKVLDDILVQLGSCVPVDLMPGEYDPSNQFLPQQPLHKCMFPKALSYSTVQSVTNPYKASVGGFRILGTSGQNITNIFQFSEFRDHIDILETTLKSGHVAPTCPDTLSCYPYRQTDPFIIEDCPDIYFAGNQPLYEARHLEKDDGSKILVLTIPSFYETGVAALVNLHDLSSHPIRIDTLLS